MTTKHDARRARANLLVTREQIARGAGPVRDHAAREQLKQERLAAARKAHAKTKPAPKKEGAAGEGGSDPAAATTDGAPAPESPKTP